jgi:hypothetical protein
MRQFVIGVGLVALALAGCTSEDSGESVKPDSAKLAMEAAAKTPETQGSWDAQLEPVKEVAVLEPCALFDNIDIEALISTEAGGFNARARECSVGAADPGLFASASITLGKAPALPVIRNNYNAALYTCNVVDVEALGDQAFSCLGNKASSHVVFASGEYLVMFSAGNNVKGPPPDTVIMEAAQQIHANLSR